MITASEKLARYLADKRILILGFGREGRSTLAFIRKHLPGKPVTVGDLRVPEIDDPLVSLDCGEKYLDSLGDYDLVFKSPGIPFRGVRRPGNTEITCQTDMFLRFADCPVAGVTGTKGKTTTSTLIYLILKAAGKKASLIGNMGIPVLDSIDMGPDETAVIEMSSHQLEFTRSSPRVAVLTNLYEEHLDHYDDGFEGYKNAKLNIVRHQKAGDVFIYNMTQGIDGIIDPAETASRKIGVPMGGFPFVTEQVRGLNERLFGDHHMQDISYAYVAAQALGAADIEAVKKAVREYTGIPHRLERFGVFGGVPYYDDAIATIPVAVEYGIRAVGSVGTLIIGGLDRGIDYTEFESFLLASDIDSIICLPDTGHIIADSLTAAGTDKRILKVKDLPEAAEAAKKYTAPGRACVLSPAAASYNIYRNFEEKGDHFKALIRDLYGQTP